MIGVAFRSPLGRVAALLAVATATVHCGSSVHIVPSDAGAVLNRQLLDAPNPAAPGPFAVRRLYYGSGTDTRRIEFRDSVSIVTSPVDASKLIDLGDEAKERNAYWGFDPTAFPLNGRVWYPDGRGPFPLVLIVHGNRDPKDFSDPGYGYLGELLASRGFILASVDMNFVNGGIRGENDARGWLLLEHLKAWRRFNDTEDSPFHGRVDMGNIALAGHSRGGGAVGHAAAFNRLSHYPDDATLEFHFDFDIKSIIAIAPVDGQYLPTGRFVPVENVNYLVFHGSHDGDVTSFHGLRLYHRVRFTDNVPRFKAAVYVYRANHGQWNTIWGNHDNGKRSGRILDLSALLDAEDQRTFGKIYISAFLEATLKGDKRYLPIFRDHRVIGGWLPKTMYITRFQTSRFKPLVTYEEDIDVTSGTASGVRLDGDSLSTWRESRLQLRSRNRRNTSSSQDNQAVWLGWNNRIAGPDTTRRGRPAAYVVTLPDTLARAWQVDTSTTLDFLLAPTNAVPEPRTPAADSTESARRARRGRPRTEENDADRPPIDLTVVVTDGRGSEARVVLSRYGAIRRPWEIGILRRSDQERQRFPERSEVILQSYSILLRDFERDNPRLDLATLHSIRFVFDRTAAGTVVLDDIGLSKLDPAFTRVSAAGR